jgi:hypothetical protein
LIIYSFQRKVPTYKNVLVTFNNFIKYIKIVCVPMNVRNCIKLYLGHKCDICDINVKCYSLCKFVFSGPNREGTSSNLILETPLIATVAPFDLTSLEIEEDGGSFMSHSLSGEMRSQCLWGPEPQMNVLEKSIISSSELAPKTYHTNLPGFLTCRITKHHSTDPRAEITPNLSTELSLRGPEPQMTVLEKSSISSSEPVPETYHTNLPGVLTSQITKHHSTAPRAQITPHLSTKQSLRDGLAKEHSYSKDKVMLEIRTFTFLRLSNLCIN